MYNFYTYVFLDPRYPGDYEYLIDGVRYSFGYRPFYVGKGHSKISDSGIITYDRINSHLYEKNRDYLFYQVLRSILKQYSKKDVVANYIIKLVDGVEEDRAFELETKFIQGIGRLDLNRGPLYNQDDGGAGASLSESVKSKISNSRKGKCTGKDNTNYGKGYLLAGKNNPYYGKQHNIKIRSKMNKLYIAYNMAEDKYYLVRGLDKFQKDHNCAKFYHIINKNESNKGWKVAKVGKEHIGYYSDLLDSTVVETYIEVTLEQVGNYKNLLTYEEYKERGIIKEFTSNKAYYLIYDMVNHEYLLTNKGERFSKEMGFSRAWLRNCSKLGKPIKNRWLCTRLDEVQKIQCYNVLGRGSINLLYITVGRDFIDKLPLSNNFVEFKNRVPN